MLGGHTVNDVCFWDLSSVRGAQSPASFKSLVSSKVADASIAQLRQQRFIEGKRKAD